MEGLYLDCLTSCSQEKERKATKEHDPWQEKEERLTSEQEHWQREREESARLLPFAEERENEHGREQREALPWLCSLLKRPLLGCQLVDRSCRQPLEEGLAGWRRSKPM